MSARRSERYIAPNVGWVATTACRTPPLMSAVAPTSFPSAGQFAARAYDISKMYGTALDPVWALANVSVGFERARFTAVMGPSGSGKSTLLQSIAGLDWITSGRIFIGDTEIQQLDPTAMTLLRRERMGFIFQSYNLVPALTAEKNILLPMKLAKRQVDPAVFDEVVSTLGIRDRLSHRPKELSGGQQQRVAVARALVSRPELLFADEPTGNLDSTTAAEILRYLRGAVDQHGQTIVMVTHDPRAAAMADRVVFLADGRIVGDLPDPTVDSILDHMLLARSQPAGTPRPESLPDVAT